MGDKQVSKLVFYAQSELTRDKYFRTRDKYFRTSSLITCLLFKRIPVLNIFFCFPEGKKIYFNTSCKQIKFMKYEIV